MTTIHFGSNPETKLDHVKFIDGIMATSYACIGAVNVEAILMDAKTKCKNIGGDFISDAKIKMSSSGSPSYSKCTTITLTGNVYSRNLT